MKPNDSSNASHYPLDFGVRRSVNTTAMQTGVSVRTEVPQLYNLAEVRKMLGISEWALYRLLRTNALISIRIGGRRLVSLRAIEDYIAKREAESEVNGNYGY